MAVVKVKSYSRDGIKVSSHTRGVGSSSRKTVGDCSKSGVTKKYKELSYMTKSDGKFTTGNKALDKVIESRATKAVVDTVSKYVKHPVVKGGIKLAPKMRSIGANTARAKATWDETCKKRK